MIKDKTCWCKSDNISANSNMSFLNNSVLPQCLYQHCQSLLPVHLKLSWSYLTVDLGNNFHIACWDRLMNINDMTCKYTIVVWPNNLGAGGVYKMCMSSLIQELLKFQCCIKIISFNVWVRYFVWNFKGYLWNSTQNILPRHWKMWIFSASESLWDLRFNSS